jgi:hypothetical protein
MLRVRDDTSVISARGFNFMVGLRVWFMIYDMEWDGDWVNQVLVLVDICTS